MHSGNYKDDRFRMSLERELACGGHQIMEIPGAKLRSMKS